MKPEQVFRARVPWYMRQLIDDFGFAVDDAAAIMGNAGHESLGFTALQEFKPVVKGSRGGYGIFQWTGPRRRKYEAWCAEQGLSPASDQANYGFLAVELRGSEKAAVAAVKKAASLREKVVIFEKKFERAGVKHYESRYRWAMIALDAFKKAKPQGPEPEPKPEPEAEQPAAPTRMRWWEKGLAWLSGLGGAGGLGGILAVDNWQVAAVIVGGALIAGGVVYFTYLLPKWRARRRK